MAPIARTVGVQDSVCSASGIHAEQLSKGQGGDWPGDLPAPSSWKTLGTGRISRQVQKPPAKRVPLALSACRGTALVHTSVSGFPTPILGWSAQPGSRWCSKNYKLEISCVSSGLNESGKKSYQTRCVPHLLSIAHLCSILVWDYYNAIEGGLLYTAVNTETH